MSITEEYYGFTSTKHVTADAAGGGVGSAGDPWTLAEAMTNAVAGDIVGIAAGVYVGISTDSRYLSAFRPSNSGTPGNPIRFVAQWAAAAHTSDLTDIRCGNTDNSSTEIIEYSVTVASRAGGSGNAFYIDGSESPSLSLIRGNTYRFLQSDGTNTNHPFKLSTVADGTHGGGSEYTSGVTEVGIPGSSDTYVQYVVPYNAPEELYYFCDNHTGMGNSVTIPSNQGCSAFGTWQQDYIEWVGILSDHNDSNNWVHAPNSCVGVWSGDYVKVYGCKLIGNTSQPVSDNYCGIRHEVGDYCEMHNNIISGFSSPSATNKAGFITYKNHFTKIYNNEIFDCGHGIQPKGSSTRNIMGLEIYKNKVYNCGHFIRQHSPIKGPLGELNKVYQNIVYDCTNIFEFTTSEGVIKSDGMRIFNNVFYNTSSYKGVAWTVGDWRVAGEVPRDNEFFNNIVSSDTESTTYLGADNTISDLGYYIDFINPDRNVVHNVGKIINAENGANLDGTTWSQWQTAGADVNSTQSDPLFTNPSIQDFTLGAGSSALTLGRDREGQFGAADATIPAGVYVTGNEVIGIDAEVSYTTTSLINQLPAANYVPAKLPMRLIYPRIDTETGTYARHKFAHTGMDYRIPVGVMGGAWPFYYEVISGPSGLTVGGNYGDTDYGVVNWPAASVAAAGAGPYSVTVRVTDQEETEVDAVWEIAVDDTQFVFIDSATGTSGAGTIGDPLKLFTDWFEGDVESTTYQNKIAVFRSGTYTVTGEGSGGNGNNINLNCDQKTRSLIGYPGETSILDCALAKIMVGNDGFYPDFYVGGLTFQNARKDVDDAHFFWLTNARSENSRVVFHENTFDTINFGEIGDDNSNSIFFSSGVESNGARENVLIKGNNFLNMTTTAVEDRGAGWTGNHNGGCFTSYKCDYHLIEENTTSGGDNEGLALYVKGNVKFNTVRANNTHKMISVNHGAEASYRPEDNNGGLALVPHDFEVCWNKVILPPGAGIGNVTSLTWSGSDYWEGEHYNNYIYRNTFKGGRAFFRFEGTEPYEVEDNIIEHSANNFAGFVQADYTYAAGRETLFVDDIEDGSFNTAFTDASGNLFDDAGNGNARTTYFGTKGAEVSYVAAEPPQTTNFVIPTATFQVQNLYRQLTSPLYDGNYPTGARP